MILKIENANIYSKKSNIKTHFYPKIIGFNNAV